MTEDRMSDGYQPDFDLDLARGQQGELFVSRVAEMLGEGTGQIEVKTDEMVSRTGNVFIEYECLRRGQYRPSGIAATKALLWAFVLPANVVIVAPVESVLAVARKHYPQYKRECIRGSHPTKGIAVPVGLLVKELYRYQLPLDGAA